MPQGAISLPGIEFGIVEVLGILSVFLKAFAVISLGW
jgi:hypothetical protein